MNRTEASSTNLENLFRPFVDWDKEKHSAQFLWTASWSSTGSSSINQQSDRFILRSRTCDHSIGKDEYSESILSARLKCSNEARRLFFYTCLIRLSSFSPAFFSHVSINKILVFLWMKIFSRTIVTHSFVYETYFTQSFPVVDDGERSLDWLLFIIRSSWISPNTKLRIKEAEQWHWLIELEEILGTHRSFIKSRWRLAVVINDFSMSDHLLWVAKSDSDEHQTIFNVKIRTLQIREDLPPPFL